MSSPPRVLALFVGIVGNFSYLSPREEEVSSNFEVANKGTLLLHSHSFLSPRRAAAVAVPQEKYLWEK